MCYFYKYLLIEQDLGTYILIDQVKLIFKVIFDENSRNGKHLSCGYR